jgi:streptogramin lyase
MNNIKFVQVAVAVAKESYRNTVYLAALDSDGNVWACEDYGPWGKLEPPKLEVPSHE